MSGFNDVFLEEFKRLDRLCRDIYQTQKGVTSYIEDMKGTPPYKSACIPNWDADLKRLTGLRRLRNQLNHEVGTLHMELCTQSDVDWLRSFYERIIHQTDPIALLRGNRNAAAAQCKSVAKPQNVYFRRTMEPSRRPSGCLASFPTFAFCLLAAALAVIAYELILC